MNAPINRPQAIDIDANTIAPHGTLEVCNHLLDDHDALEAFYEAKGYLFFRDVLDAGSVAEARAKMLEIAAQEFGLIEPGDEAARWTGKAYPPMSEELPCFAGISRALVENPANQAVLTKILGEAPSMVPIVQYRLYPPHGPVTLVHQDGFFSPGIQDYKPLWIALTDCPREVGGLMVAVGQNNRGYLHNLAKPAPHAIPADAIDPTTWSTIDYHPGDLLVVHPYTPHCSMPNTSDRLRISFDTRVQSARNPTTFRAIVEGVTPVSLRVRREGESVMLSLDPETFVRIREYGRREAFENFDTVIEPGMELVVVQEDERCAMLRKVSPV